MQQFFVFWLLFICFTHLTYAQSSYISGRDSSEISLFEYVTKIPKRSNVLDLNLEMHASFNTYFVGNKVNEASFRFNQIKLEATGEVNDWLFYWYRQLLNQGNHPMETENLPESIEYALIGFKLSDKFSLIVGKQAQDLGGYEYDLNPFEIYEYSDMNEYMDCYFTGITLAYQLKPSQELRFQITNNRIGSMEETFGTLSNEIQKSKLPLLYNINWNSSYFDESLNLRYSFSISEQAKKQKQYTIFAGHNLLIGNVDTYFDVMYTRGGLDPLGIITELNGTEEVTCAQYAEYLSFVTEVNYRFHPKWNLFAKGMYETASIYKNNGSYQKGKYRTAWGYQGGIEFYPMQDDNLHIFFTGVGRSYGLTKKAKTLNASIENTQRLSIGFIYKLPLF